jgi:glyceraldehyde 3-phosphate dehydrogenase
VLFEQPEAFELVHMNDLGAAESTAYLCKYDSVHGTWAHGCAAQGDDIVLTDATRAGRVLRVPYSRAKEPAALGAAYTALGVALVLECTGVFLTRAALAPYFAAGGVRKVVVSAPVKDAEPVLNVVVGVNHALYQPAVDHIVTAASCTTNCLAPVVKARMQRGLGARMRSLPGCCRLRVDCACARGRVCALACRALRCAALARNARLR